MASSRKSAPADPEALYRRFCAVAMPYVAAGGSVAVGYSGGLDSTVLLQLFHRLRAQQPFALQAFHLHHGLSANADAWLAHCTAGCAGLSLPFTHARADLAATAGDSLEARARAARYAAYAGLDAERVALGHHRDDQVETVLYRLARGAGVHGAAGMPALRPLGADKLVWRPLLGESRAELLAYAVAHGMRWIEDESNDCTDHDRNYLRHALIPGLVARFPSAPSALARAARHFGEAAGLLDALAEQDAGGPVERLALAALTPLEEARRRNLLRWFLARHDLRPDEKQLRLLLDQLLHAREDTNPCLRLADREVHRYRGEIWVSQRAVDVRPCAVAPADAGGLPGWRGRIDWTSRQGGLDERFLSGLQARPRAGGEMLRPRSGGPNRPVKLLLQEAGIPPWFRSRWPLLWQNERLVALAGIAVAAECQADGLAPWPDWRCEDWTDFGRCRQAL
ncbi:tRNA lysidine(34) synthetase TilS [Chitinimonas arctica]|uniref:tRNA(Ile)-lysidine synthase n=1 Tax=Chitinimonas arctica TaxID=2594795 RepID=A0A516SJ52_9NEIS|nr:tRNA lysidine(34) synthetase TilS [Chitinimonas arctica]QDQ28189.1 tRNA lysidine(34) synthetase TilS [Chitinimonas arctica]